MKKLLIVLLGSLAAFSAYAADARGTVVNQEITHLARILQSRLPSLSVDGLLEAERQAHGWVFRLRVKSDAGGADEVQVVVHDTPDGRSELRVQGVRVDNNLFTSKRSANDALTTEWTDRILKLAEKTD